MKFSSTSILVLICFHLSDLQKYSVLAERRKKTVYAGARGVRVVASFISSRKQT